MLPHWGTLNRSKMVCGTAVKLAFLFLFSIPVLAHSQDSPSPVITLSQLSTTSVRVSWTLPLLNFTVTRYEVTVRRLTACNSVTHVRGPRNQDADDMSEVFEDLVEYIYYRAEVNVFFQSASTVTSELEFTTLALAPSEVPSNVVPITTSRSISVSWDPIDCANQNGPNFRYDVDFLRMDGTAAPVGTVNDERFTVEGLRLFTNYTFRVRGVNDAGNGPYTNLRVIQTNGEAPSAIPSNVVALVQTSRTVSVTWDAIDSRNQNGPNFHYEVDFLRTNGGAVPVGTVNNLVFTVEGLQPFTNYTLRVRGVNDAGNGNYTRPIVLRTNADVPDVPSTVRMVAVTSTTISVSWDAIIPPNSANLHYEGDFQRIDEGAVPIGAIVNTKFTVVGLQPFTNYTFRVRGVNEVGNGNYTSPITIQTDQDKPGVVAGLETRLTSYTSVLVSWSPPQEPNGIVIMYELTYRLPEQGPTSENITINRLNSTIFSEVNSRVTGIRVRAYTSVGPGPFAMTAPVSLAPSIVMNVQVESLTDTSVIVTWDRITESPEIAEYVVYYAPVSSQQDNEQSVTVPSTENSAEINGLESTVKYHYQVTAVALVLGGLRLEGERSTLTDSTKLMIAGGTTDVTVAVSISVVVTFLLTIILNNALLLVGYKIFHAHHKKRSKIKNTAETSGIALKKNTAYVPATSGQQPQDYIYDQPKQ